MFFAIAAIDTRTCIVKFHIQMKLHMAVFTDQCFLFSGHVIYPLESVTPVPNPPIRRIPP